MPGRGKNLRSNAIGVLLALVATGALADSEIIYNPVDGHSYQMIESHMWRQDAELHCDLLGGYLATLTSFEEDQFVYQNLVATSAADGHWLGGSDELQEGTWQWTTGEPWAYSHWGPGEPNSCGGDEDYLWMWQSGYWNDNAADASNCNGPPDEFLTYTLCEWGGAMQRERLDIGSWTDESYPPAADPPFVAEWGLAPDNLSVTQTGDGQPSFFYSDFGAVGMAIELTIRVWTESSDDDFIGFALGFEPGDTVDAEADFLLVDWKQASQFMNWDEACPEGSFLAPAGLAVSRVSGTPTVDELWGHFNDPCSGAGSGVAELQRGANLGNVGWSNFRSYRFRFELSETSLRVFVDGVEELSIAGSFADGRLAFYNFSQAGAEYGAAHTDAAAQWVWWDPATGGNGRYYRAVTAPAGVNWPVAQAAALGRQGHLASAGSADENDFIFSLVDSPEFWRDNPDNDWAFGPWLGGLQPPGSPEPDGGWIWVTGEPFSYTNWGPFQPNNAYDNQDRVHLAGPGYPGRSPTWNDHTAAVLLPGYVVETTAPQGSYFFDDFDGSELDLQKWLASLGPPRLYCDADCSDGYWTVPTGSPSYGSISVQDSQVALHNESSTVFPYVESRVNPFPEVGDFVLELEMTYERVTTHGSGLWVLHRDSDNPLWPLSNRVFRVWADNDGDYVFLFDQVWFRAPRDTSEHVYTLEHSDGAYSVLVDGSPVLGPVASSVRPNQIAFGNAGWAWWFPALWSTFLIDHVEVRTEGGINMPPVALCRDVEVAADPEACQADASIDDGSYDPDGDGITLTQAPPGPYGLGETLVELTVSDGSLEDTCQATVTVVDRTTPTAWCNAPGTITPRDPPVSFTAAATDNCGVQGIVVQNPLCYKINGRGERVDVPCHVSTAGATITILNTGGVGTFIGWEALAEDIAANSGSTSCEVETVNPGLCSPGDDLYLAGWVVDGEETFEASDAITAVDFHILPPGGDVMFVTGRSIALGDGFSVDEGCRFTAVIDAICR